jgi:hypothetical protein
MSSAVESRGLVLFDEAKRCREARAYCAAFILIWIAVAEGLRWRFAEMGNEILRCRSGFRKRIRQRGKVQRSTNAFSIALRLQV